MQKCVVVVMGVEDIQMIQVKFADLVTVVGFIIVGAAMVLVLVNVVGVVQRVFIPARLAGAKGF